MTKYIECEAAIALASGGCHPVNVAAEIAKLPAADVRPVVLCRECKYRLEDNFCTGRGWPKQMVTDDGFCEKGKRKDGDGEC